MNICSDKHDEIAFEARRCPICPLIEDRDKIIATMTDEMRDLENRVRELENP
jgi:hypothetical protein